MNFLNNWSRGITLALDATTAPLELPDGPYRLTLSDSLSSATRWEVVDAVVVAGSATLARAQEGTAAQGWPEGSVIFCALTAGVLTQLFGQGALAATALQPGALAVVATSGAYADLLGKPTIPTTAAQVGAIAAAEKGAASGVATLDAGSKIPLAQLPATAITDTSVVISQAAMLALTAQTGDVAVRTDISTSFILTAEPASTLGNWQQLLSPASGGGAAVGSAVPQALGTATPGVSASASREDHVHAMPTAANVGADAAGSAAAAQAAAVQRGNHTGTQLASTIIDFAASVRSTVLTGLSLAVGTAVAATDTVLEAFGKVQKQITDLTTTVSGKQASLVSGTNIKTINGATVLGSGDLVVGGGATLPVIRAITVSETLGLSNINSFGVNSTASNYVSTVPAQATVVWTADAELHFLPKSTGTLTITAAAGVTLNGVTAGSLTLSTKDGAATLKRTGLNAWWCGGVLGTLAEQRAALGANDAGNLTAGTIPDARVSAALTPDKAFRRGNILGTASQSTGVPTGAIIERGSNANGEYVRFADGTQICTRIASETAEVTTSAFGGFKSADITWIFPAGFTVNPSVVTNAGGGSALGGVIQAITSVSATYHYITVTSSASQARFMILTANGRWF
jgi:hypothetical protein